MTPNLSNCPPNCGAVFSLVLSHILVSLDHGGEYEEMVSVDLGRVKQQEVSGQHYTPELASFWLLPLHPSD